MNKIENVVIENFWGDKKVNIVFKPDVNFLIGVNGSGKTTIINLIAATLNADFTTLDSIEFKKILITLKPNEDHKSAFIEVEKIEQKDSPYSNINYKIKNYVDSKSRNFILNDLVEERLYSGTIYKGSIRRIGYTVERDVNLALQSLVNVSWLSIHRMSNPTKRREERSFESTIDLKIRELQNDLIKYFSQLNAKYADETAKFQKYIFESLIDINNSNTLKFTAIDAEKEKESLSQIFSLFKLNEPKTNKKLEGFFNNYKIALEKYDNRSTLEVRDLSYLINTQRVHSVVQEWSKLIVKQKNINQPKEIFLTILNSLLQRKSLSINEKNEIIVTTDSGKTFPLTSLSSGEKQLLIILGQSLLQENNTHIYIADEPELSLHIDWQEKIVTSLKSLNPNSQIIFATHSPDIVGEYTDSVIKVEKTIK